MYLPYIFRYVNPGYTGLFNGRLYMCRRRIVISLTDLTTLCVYESSKSVSVFLTPYVVIFLVFCYVCYHHTVTIHALTITYL